MKARAVGLALAIVAPGMAMVGGADSQRRPGWDDFPPGCIVAVAVAPGFLPRAGLMVDNRLDRPVRVRLEARAGSGLAAADFGTIGSVQQRTFTHALPAGRNALTVEEGAGRARRQVLVVNNHGAGTCSRRSLLRIE